MPAGATRQSVRQTPYSLPASAVFFLFFYGFPSLTGGMVPLPNGRLSPYRALEPPNTVAENPCAIFNTRGEAVSAERAGA